MNEWFDNDCWSRYDNGFYADYSYYNYCGNVDTRRLDDCHFTDCSPNRSCRNDHFAPLGDHNGDRFAGYRGSAAPHGNSGAIGLTQQVKQAHLHYQTNLATLAHPTTEEFLRSGGFPGRGRSSCVGSTNFPNRQDAAEICSKCGWSHHNHQNKCPAANTFRQECGRNGHFLRVCHSSRGQIRSYRCHTPGSMRGCQFVNINNDPFG